jgi:PAS domain S-box-containing protein
MNTLPEEKLFQDLIDHAPDIGAAIVSPDGRWIKVNGYLCDMLGYTEDELLSLTFQEITHPDDLESEKPYLQRLTAGGIDHYQFHKRYLHRDGHILWGVLNRSVVRGDSGAPEFFVSRIRDITAEKLAEQRNTGFFRSLGTKLRSSLGLAART